MGKPESRVLVSTHLDAFLAQLSDPRADRHHHPSNPSGPGRPCSEPAFRPHAAQRARTRTPEAADHAGTHPGLPHRPPVMQPRTGGRHRAVGPIGAEREACPLHRGGLRRRLLPVAERRAAAAARPACRRPRLRPCRRGVPPQRLLGRAVQEQPSLDPRARSGLPLPARTRDVVFPRVRGRRWHQDPAQRLDTARPVEGRPCTLDHQPGQLLGDRRPALQAQTHPPAAAWPAPLAATAGPPGTHGQRYRRVPGLSVRRGRRCCAGYRCVRVRIRQGRRAGNSLWRAPGSLRPRRRRSTCRRVRHRWTRRCRRACR